MYNLTLENNKNMWLYSFHRGMKEFYWINCINLVTRVEKNDIVHDHEACIELKNWDSPPRIATIFEIQFYKLNRYINNE